MRRLFGIHRPIHRQLNPSHLTAPGAHRGHPLGKPYPCRAVQRNNFGPLAGPLAHPHAHRPNVTPQYP